MRFNILSDANWDSKISKTLSDLSDFDFRRIFESLDYGSGLFGVTVVFMCRDPDLNFKRRVRFSRKESKIYLDIMLDLPAMKIATPEQRRREVTQRLYEEVPEVLGRYKIPDFNRDAFIVDLRDWIDSTGW